MYTTSLKNRTAEDDNISFAMYNKTYMPPFLPDQGDAAVKSWLNKWSGFSLNFNVELSVPNSDPTNPPRCYEY